MAQIPNGNVATLIKVNGNTLLRIRSNEAPQSAQLPAGRIPTLSKKLPLATDRLNLHKACLIHPLQLASGEDAFLRQSS